MLFLLNKDTFQINRKPYILRTMNTHINRTEKNSSIYPILTVLVIGN